MAPRSRRSAAAAKDVVEEEDEEQVQAQGQEPEEAIEQQDGLKMLRFKQPLVGKPGRQISVGDLLTRLKALLDELRTMDQEEAHRDTLMPVAQDLAHQ
jgi:sister-chromatid-cohesion protein PDS5